MLREFLAVPGCPAGLGFAADSRLLVATALDRRLLWVGMDGAVAPAADPSPLARSYLNDMVLDAAGRTWVGDTGFRFGSAEPEAPGALIVVDAAGPRGAAADIRFPNGIAVTPDGRTLYLAETLGRRVTAFDMAVDSAL